MTVRGVMAAAIAATSARKSLPVGTRTTRMPR